jgi:hypothetical protein
MDAFLCANVLLQISNIFPLFFTELCETVIEQNKPFQRDYVQVV